MVEGDESTSETSSSESVSIRLTAEPSTCYAAHQNNVPLVREIILGNDPDTVLHSVELVITSEPGFADSLSLRFDALQAGEVRRIAPVDVRLSHAFLSHLDEATRGQLIATVMTGGKEVGRTVQDIDLLPYDQWPGRRSLPELLAAFAMPNNAAVDRLLHAAAMLLQKGARGQTLDGYQSKNREAIWAQVSAIYSAIGASNILYANPPASFEAEGQRIRTPDRILDGGIATCLDLAMLLASCLEQAGLNPVVLFKQGHAWVGAWLVNAHFPTPVVEDAQAVRKRIKAGELITFETTGLGKRPVASLRWATERGTSYLEDEDAFLYAIDIRRSRFHQIRPLPSRHEVILGPEEKNEPFADHPAIEDPPTFPPLSGDFFDIEEEATPDTPQGRLERWKSKLLDLTLRNRLINFKPTRVTVRLRVPEPDKLEDALSEGAELKFRSLPRVMEGADPRDAAIYAGRTGADALDVLARASLAQGEVFADVSLDELEKQLSEIFSVARTNLEEGGANTLYLALGFLRWTETERAERTQRAPLLLIPVTLQRQSVRTGYRLKRHDDDAIVNPTLLQLLRQPEHNLVLRGLDPLPMDQHGVDVARIFQTFRLAVSDIPHWEVIEDVYLGIFSFTKFLMWKDLQDRAAELHQNPIVAHLIDHPYEAYGSDAGDLRDVSGLDERYPPGTLFTPLLADSSQVNVIARAAEGKDLVVEGPPGTGKSQTISNLIAHFLATGKTVLFVSEKMAALEVVHRRLNAIGLGPFCLELHSSKARKTEVLQQLKAALDACKTYPVEEWQHEAERLRSLRNDLNALVRALHHVHPNGLTVYAATGTSMAHQDGAPAHLPWSDPDLHDRKAYEALKEIARRIAALGAVITHPGAHPLRQIQHNDWSHGWEDQFHSAVVALDAEAARLESAGAAVSEVLGIGAQGQSLDGYRALDRLCDLLLRAPTVPQGVAAHATDVRTRLRLQTLRRHGEKRQVLWGSLKSQYRSEVVSVKGAELATLWDAACQSWALKRWLAQRAMSKRLAPYTQDRRRPALAVIQSLIDTLPSLNQEDAALGALQPDAEALLLDTYRGSATDWTAVARHERWVADLNEALTRLAGATAADEAALRDRINHLGSEQRAVLAVGGSIGRALLAFRDSQRVFTAALNVTEALAETAGELAGGAGDPGLAVRIRGTLIQWLSAWRGLRDWCAWRSVRQQALANELQGVIEAVESGAVSIADTERFLVFSYQTWWLKLTIDRDPTLRQFASADHERKIKEFREADARFEVLTKRYIQATLAGRVPQAQRGARPDPELGLVLREQAKQRAHIPVRKLIQGLPTLLARLKPCLLMSPLSVAQYLSTSHAPFDLVVFDEASQIPVWDAVGAIARGRQLVMVGDPKQLPPTSFFSKGESDDEDSPQGVDAKDLESILDECLGAGLPKLSLDWHYRSKHESLITFSNQRYYDGRLVTFPSPVTEDLAVSLRYVGGVYDRGGSRTNRTEAEAIVAEIREHIGDPARKALTIGVLTFNQPQQRLIETLLEAAYRADVEFERAVQGLEEPLFIKNLENVQGDERDVILFSITYGADATGRVTMNFGPLNLDGGERRLNVAITRARVANVLFASIKPEQIEAGRIRSAGVQDLKTYLDFALRGPRAILERSLPTGLEPDSPFECEVIRALRDHGYEVHPQVGCSGYRIDIGIVDPSAQGRYLMGVECDGATYHSFPSARDRDRLRQQVLEGLGWNIYRIWSTDWWRDKKRETKRLLAAVDISNSGKVC